MRKFSASIGNSTCCFSSYRKCLEGSQFRCHGIMSGSFPYQCITDAPKCEAGKAVLQQMQIVVMRDYERKRKSGFSDFMPFIDYFELL